jgi:hypothetical protein
MKERSLSEQLAADRVMANEWILPCVDVVQRVRAHMAVPSETSFDSFK